MSVRENRARSHEVSVSVYHHADEWLLAPQTQDRDWTRGSAIRPRDAPLTARQSAGRVAGTMVGRP